MNAFDKSLHPSVNFRVNKSDMPRKERNGSGEDPVHLNDIKRGFSVRIQGAP